MLYSVKIYNKFMKLVKIIKSSEISETFWREKSRKKDAELTTWELKNLGLKNLRSNFPKEYNIICRMCGKKAKRKSARAVYCSDECTNKSQRRRDNESKAKRHNTRRKGKKRIW